MVLNRRSFLVAQALVAGWAAVLHAQEHDTVWVWNARCHGPTMIVISVRLDSTTLYRRSVPICRWERRFESGKSSFRFTSPRALIWFGYRSDEDTTPAKTPFEVKLWQAGGEGGAIELGVVADAPDGLHMNAIHMLLPDERNETTLADGFVLVTWPDSSRSAHRSSQP